MYYMEEVEQLKQSIMLLHFVPFIKFEIILKVIEDRVNTYVFSLIMFT